MGVPPPIQGADGNGKAGIHDPLPLPPQGVHTYSIHDENKTHGPLGGSNCFSVSHKLAIFLLGVEGGVIVVTIVTKIDATMTLRARPLASREGDLPNDAPIPTPLTPS